MSEERSHARKLHSLINTATMSQGARNGYTAHADNGTSFASPSSSSLPTSLSTGYRTPGNSSTPPSLLSPSSAALWGFAGINGDKLDTENGLLNDFSEQQSHCTGGDGDGDYALSGLPHTIWPGHLSAGESLSSGGLSPQGGSSSTSGHPSSKGQSDESAENDQWHNAGLSSRSHSNEGGFSSAEMESKQKAPRRQGVTCDHCRSKHIRCVPAQASTSKEERCQRCVEKSLDCTRTYQPPSRRYPRPSRTGKRIEMARMLHGTVYGTATQPSSVARGPQSAFSLLLQPAMPHVSNTSLYMDVLTGSTSLRLLTCFFATAHMQMPIVDFHNFSARYNFARGDCRIMSIMARGGDDAQKIPAARQSAPGINTTTWPPTLPAKSSDAHSTLSTPGTTEALIAAMHAWAALYTDMPIAFGSAAAWLALREQKDDQQYAFSNTGTSAKRSQPQEPLLSSGTGPNGKTRRLKRKQGVACDTCRLRRLRCDKLERPEGTGCTRCEDKRIVCTDDYIQSKRKKLAGQGQEETNEVTEWWEADDDELTDAKFVSTDLPTTSLSPLDEHDVVGSSPVHARDVPRGSGPASWSASQEQTQWIDEGPRLPGSYRFGHAREMLVYGTARQSFFQSLLQRAIGLVHKHKLIEQPSIEAIQAMMILVQVMDTSESRKESARESEAGLFYAASCHHTRVLGLESTDEVDEQDRHAVEQLLGAMQRKRLWCCVWTRDAIISGLFRRSPTFQAERALGIRGARGRHNATSSPGPPTASSAPQSSIATVKILVSGAHQDPFSKVQMPASPSNPGPSSELNGEMGLSFSILALMQIGALSRFLGKHLDNIDVTPDLDTLMSSSLGLSGLDARIPMGGNASLLPPAMRFPMLPTQAELRKLMRACHALWKSIDALLLFFDKCALAAQHNMDTLHPFNPLGWIATIKVAGAMLDLCSFRILSERLQLAQTYLGAIRASSLPTSDPSERQDEDSRVMQLQTLQHMSQRRTLRGCRRIAKLTEHLLSKRVFHTGGAILRHLVLVAQYLARSPSEVSFDGELVMDSLSAPSPDSMAAPSSSAGGFGIDPRSVFGGGGGNDSSSIVPDAAGATATASSPTGSAPAAAAAAAAGASASSDRSVPAALFSADLEPFTLARKQHEVAVCLEAVAQLGYAWPGMDMEISLIEEMLRASSAEAAA